MGHHHSKHGHHHEHHHEHHEKKHHHCHKEHTSELTQNQQPMFTKCQIDYYTETFSYFMFGIGLALGTRQDVQEGMLNVLSTVLSTVDFAAETLMDNTNGSTDLVSGVAYEMASMTRSTLDEVTNYDLGFDIWDLIRSIKVAFVQTFH